MDLTVYHYQALEHTSSARLLQVLREAAGDPDLLVTLYTPFGESIFTPAWACACCLAEREEEEAYRLRK